MNPRALPLLLMLLIPARVAGQEDVSTAAAPVDPVEMTDAVVEPADTGAGTTTATDSGTGAEPFPESMPGPQTESLPAGEAGEPPGTEAAVVGAPVQPVESVQEEERIRSMIILIAALALIAALIGIIVLLIRRGHELRPAQVYVAEAYLNDIQGSTPQPTYKLGTKPVMLGRVAGKDTEHVDYIVIPQSTIGRRHALIEYKDFAYWIMDQGSINGTFVNDKAVTSEIRLKHGDRVRLHKYQFDFVMPDVGDTGKTVLSETGFAGKGVEQEGPGLGQKAAAAISAEEAELLRNLSLGEDQVPGGRKSLTGDEETLLPSHGPVSDEETLLPVSAAPHPAPDDETLLPGGASGDEGELAPDSEDETLLPGASPPPSTGGGGAKKKEDDDSGDEFFDITGSDQDADK